MKTLQIPFAESSAPLYKCRALLLNSIVMHKIITTEVYKISNDKKLDINLAITRSHLKVEGYFAIMLNFQIGQEFSQRKLLTKCRKYLDHRAMWINVFLFMQEWFRTRKQDDNIFLAGHQLIFTEGLLKEVTYSNEM